MGTTTIIVIAVVVLLVVWVIGIYNNLVTLRNNRENAFANIDVQLKQRYDLIPNLVNTVKGYAEHEKSVLERVTAARTAAMGATTLNEKIEAENALSSALAGLKISVEAYPDLKPELPAITERTGRHREQVGCCAPLLQQRHQGTQQWRAEVPCRTLCRHVRLPSGADV